MFSKLNYKQLARKRTGFTTYEVKDIQGLRHTGFKTYEIYDTRGLRHPRFKSYVVQDIQGLRHTGLETFFGLTHSEDIRFRGHQGVCLDPSWAFR